MSDKISMLSHLPLKTSPGYSLYVCLSKVGPLLEKVEKNIKPSFFRKLMGGVSKDHARSVVATCHADLIALIRIISQIQSICVNMSNSDNEAIRHKGSALTGYCERLITACKDWSASASGFESNIFGSDKILIEQCVKLDRLQETLTAPVAKLGEQV